MYEDLPGKQLIRKIDDNTFVDKITNREIRNILRQMLDDEENEDKSRKSRYVYCIKTWQKNTL